MKKQLALAASVMAAGSVAMATDYYTAGDVVVTGAKMETFTQSWCAPTTITGTGASWSVNVGINIDGGWGWEEGGASYTFKVPANTKVTLKGGTVTSNLPTTGESWGDIIMYATTVEPKSLSLSGLTPMSNAQRESFVGNTTDAWLAGYDYYMYDSGSSFSNAYLAVMNYGSNVENLQYGGGQAILGGEYAYWNQTKTAPSSSPIGNYQYTWTGGLQRVMADQLYTFNGSLTTTGTSDWYVTVVVKGGFENQDTGSIAIENLTIGLTHDVNAPNAFPGYGAKTIQYNEMTSWKNQGTFTGTDGSWTMAIGVSSGWLEQGAYYAVVLPPQTKVTVTGGALTTAMPDASGTNSTYCDVTFFGMPGVGTGLGSAIADKVAGPNATPMAYMTQTYYKANYRGAHGTWGSNENSGTYPDTTNFSTANARSTGFDYIDDGSYTSYLEAIMNYGANATNFAVADSALGIQGGTYAGVTYNGDDRYLALQMGNVTSALLSSILYDGKGLGRALEDQVGTVSGVITNTSSSESMTVIFGSKTGWSSTSAGSVTFDNVQITFTSLGDFNGDGLVNEVDVTLINGAIYNGTSDLIYDVNADGVVNYDDFRYMLVTIMQSYMGDLDLNGVVDIDDYSMFVDGWYFGGDSWNTGDLDGSGSVDIDDYSMFVDGWYGLW